MLGPGQERPAQAAGIGSLEQELGISSYLDSTPPRGHIAWWAPTLGPLSSRLPPNTQHKTVREIRSGPISQTKN